jgi:hypothetical protein
MGYEPVLFERGSVFFHPDDALDKSCYDEVTKCQILVLIIGGRYGSQVSEETTEIKDESPTQKTKSSKSVKPIDNKDDLFLKFNSITSREYQVAVINQVPVYVFVEKDVLSEYNTYKKNKGVVIDWAHVDNTNVFCLIEDIYKQSKGNYIKAFEKYEDIEDWLIDQWAGLLYDYLSNKKRNTEIKAMDAKIEELSVVVNALKEYSEALLSKMAPKESQELIVREKQKVILAKFINEPLINFIIRVAERRSNVDSTRLYSDFMRSNNYDEFLTLCKFDLVQLDEINESREVALKDYERIKREYAVLNN